MWELRDWLAGHWSVKGLPLTMKPPTEARTSGASEAVDTMTRTQLIWSQFEVDRLAALMRDVTARATGIAPDQPLREETTATDARRALRERTEARSV